MDRVKLILKNETFTKLIKKIEESEKDRVFCLHGFSHCLDVARIGYIINLENELGIRKDMIYAAALLHDIGRALEYENKISHHAQGAVIAEEILYACGYTEEETKEICEAVGSHKKVEEGERDLKFILYKADKLSRNCFACAAYEECYWPEELKNKDIVD